MEPRLLVVEAARTFDAEVASIVGVFASKHYPWKVLSNDFLWAKASWPTRQAIEAAIVEFNPDIVHFHYTVA